MDSGEVERAFRDWTVAGAPDSEHIEILRHLCDQPIQNDGIRHRELLRGITVNHLQMGRVIRDLEKTICELHAANEKTQTLVIILAIIAIIVGAISAVATILSLSR